jgi:osmotically-inducible protein OsmY
MKTLITLLAMLALFLTLGCSKTAEGVKADTVANGAATSDMAKNAQAATLLTPRVKMAITSSVELKKDGNLIDVNTDVTTLTLEGHVLSQTDKDFAGKLASDILRSSGARQTLSNKLVIQKSPASN